MTGALLVCLVIGISDGDTLTAFCDQRQVKVRLAEIDAPEKKQPFGERSRQALAGLCFQKQATINNRGRDRYGRTIGRVVCDGKDASAEQVKSGLAWVYDKYVTDRTLYDLQDAARTARAGLWADAAPVPPWEWRHTRQK